MQSEVYMMEYGTTVAASRLKCYATKCTILYIHTHIQNVLGGKVSILRGHSVSQSKQESVHAHVSLSERFPR
jgi:hypothetical protein